MGTSREINPENPETLDLLLSRRSVKAGRMEMPGPGGSALEKILRAGLRVPDHGKMGPWEFIVVEGDARQKLGAEIARCYREETDKPSESVARKLADFPAQAPLLVVVASCLRDAKPIPEWEQVLSAGAACQNMLVAAHALGFVGQWLTGWAAYSPGVRGVLGLGAKDRVAGFLFMGSHEGAPSERHRAEYADVVRHWAEVLQVTDS
ncbi:MAG: nitroreductase [Proteobacteria bacterium]|nr:nitroreductase [Pseudomonadota bacterium]